MSRSYGVQCAVDLHTPLDPYVVLLSTRLVWLHLVFRSPHLPWRNPHILASTHDSNARCLGSWYCISTPEMKSFDELRGLISQLLAHTASARFPQVSVKYDIRMFVPPADSYLSTTVDLYPILFLAPMLRCVAWPCQSPHLAASPLPKGFGSHTSMHHPLYHWNGSTRCLLAS